MPKFLYNARAAIVSIITKLHSLRSLEELLVEHLVKVHVDK